ncbi:hypothetical protein EON73_00855 [bacterium]|nr:MAG: hypothetical protein EON73_00855 [bacterium]
MRNLKKEEFDLIVAILKGEDNADELIKELPYLIVEEMNDGGMGSLKFVSSTEKGFGKEIGEITLSDLDGVPVSFALNLDREGKLYELDVFKADFSKLKKFPLLPYNLIE